MHQNSVADFYKKCNEMLRWTEQPYDTMWLILLNFSQHPKSLVCLSAI